MLSWACVPHGNLANETPGQRLKLLFTDAKLSCAQLGIMLQTHNPLKQFCLAETFRKADVSLLLKAAVTHKTVISTKHPKKATGSLGGQ